MKARVKATDEIIEVDAVRRFSNERGNHIVYIDVRTHKEYDEEEVDTKDLTTLAEVRHMHTVDPDYWTRLEHQYAGMVMQALIVEYRNAQSGYGFSESIIQETCAKECIQFAHALVEKLKERRKENERE